MYTRTQRTNAPYRIHTYPMYTHTQRTNAPYRIHIPPAPQCRRHLPTCITPRTKVSPPAASRSSSGRHTRFTTSFFPRALAGVRSISGVQVSVMAFLCVTDRAPPPFFACGWSPLLLHGGEVPLGCACLGLARLSRLGACLSLNPCSINKQSTIVAPSRM